MHHLKARLIGWSAFVGFFAILAYASHFSGEKPPEDVAYRWESSILGLIQYAIVFGVVWLLTLGLDRREFLAFGAPPRGGAQRASRRLCSSRSSPPAQRWQPSAATPKRSRV